VKQHSETHTGGDMSGLEAHLVERYKVWSGWGGFAYKHVKGRRLARIIGQTGSLEGRALEVGVGPGGVARAVSEAGLAVVGIDVSPDALVTARGHCTGTAVTLARASGFSLPFPDGSFDVVYGSQVLHLFAPKLRLALLTELGRVTRRSGRLLFDMKNVATHLMQYLTSTGVRRAAAYPSRQELVALMDRAGFDVIGRYPGVLPRLPSADVPDWLRSVAHTQFYVGRRR